MNQQTTNKFWQKAGAGLSLVTLGVGIGLGSNYVINPPQTTAQNKSTEIAQARDTSVTPIDQNNFVIDVVDRAGPAVVRINASRIVQTQLPEAFNNPYFRYHFGDRMPPSERVERGTGSGFIISEDGLILTNAHVVDGADRVSVTLKDGRTLEGEVVGTDTVTDMAVVRVNERNLPTVTLGNSDELRAGEWAIAIGNPLGLDNTVTTGIVSGTGRHGSQFGVDKRVDFIQTDAAINPGNSGGPLLNARGEVVGINTAIIRDAQGIGFAIPINQAQQIAEQLIANGRVDHPFLGIQMAALTPEILEQLQSNGQFELTDTEGVLILEIVPNSPAANSSIRPGDVIKTIDGQVIESAEEVQQAVEETAIGSRLPVTVSRNGRLVDLEVQVGSLPTNS